MMWMPANHSSPIVHYLSGKYPKKVGWLVGPSACAKTKLRQWMPYALDNDAFSSWSKGKPWSVSAWRTMLQWAADSGHDPLWALIPDEVTNKKATIEKWHRFAPEARKFGWPLAFAVQDGMTHADVPADAEVVFVGGSTKWKWQTVEMWATLFPRVHVGRVNSVSKIELCERSGAESIDGTGWFRDESDQTKIPAVVDWLERSAA